MKGGGVIGGVAGGGVAPCSRLVQVSCSSGSDELLIVALSAADLPPAVCPPLPCRHPLSISSIHVILFYSLSTDSRHYFEVSVGLNIVLITNHFELLLKSFSMLIQLGRILINSGHNS